MIITHSLKSFLKISLLYGDFKPVAHYCEQYKP